MSSRRTFINQASLLSAAAFMGGTSQAFAKRSGQKQSNGFITRPYLQNLTPTSATVMFITAADAYSWVEYGTDNNFREAHSEVDGLHDAYAKLNKIRLTGLKPGTSYRYKVCSKAITLFEPYKLEYGEEVDTALFSFTTPEKDAQDVSCVVLNDVHDTPSAFGELLALHQDKPYNFVVLNGDTFDWQESEQQLIDHLLLPCTELFASEKPFIMSRGNHETRGAFRREFKKYFDYPEDRFYYSFKQGPVYWVILDTGEDKPDDHPVYAGIVNFDGYREQQARWLQQVVNSDDYKNAAFRVVLMHIPPFHHNGWHGPTHCQQLFNPIFNDNRVNLVLSGHTHRLGVHPPDHEHQYPIIIGGGSKAGSRTAIHVLANNDQLKVEMKKDDGTVVGEYQINASEVV